VDRDSAPFERDRARRHVELPHARSSFARGGNRLVPAVAEIPYPVPERERVVLAQVLDVANFETNLFERCGSLADGTQLASAACVRPTCSNIPTELIASNGQSSTAR
jgi:hypothetical protein